MRVYLVRHGESETNLIRYYTGWLQVSLTEKGIRDAVAAGKVLEGVLFDRVFSSDLIRACQTAENAIPGCRYETSDLLREYDVGSLAGNPISDVTPEMRREINANGFVAFGGESRDTFQKRVKEFFAELEQLSCENVAVFTHRGWVMAALQHVLGAEALGAKVICNNCAVAVFDYDGKAWKLHSWINQR